MSYRDILNQKKDEYFNTPREDIALREKRIRNWLKTAAPKTREQNAYPNHLFLAHYHIGLAWEQRFDLAKGTEFEQTAQQTWKETLLKAQQYEEEANANEVGKMYASLSRACENDFTLDVASRNEEAFHYMRRSATIFNIIHFYERADESYSFAVEQAKRIGIAQQDPAWIETAANMMETKAWIRNHNRFERATYLFEKAGLLFIDALKMVNIKQSFDDYDYGIHLLDRAIEQYRHAVEIEKDVGVKKGVSMNAQRSANLVKIRAAYTRDPAFISETISFFAETVESITHLQVQKEMNKDIATLETLLREIQHPQSFHK